MNIERMTEKAKTYGRKDLYILAMGTIEAISENDHYTPETKVQQIQETINALFRVRTDESLPWHAKRTPLPEGATEENLLTDSTTTWTLEEVMGREG